MLDRRRFLPLLLLPLTAGLRAAVAPSPVEGLPEGLYAAIGTPRGTIVCELHFQAAPRTVASFVGLAEGTLGPAPRKPYFDGLSFHRVVPDFVVQGGDPTGTGDGGPGYSFVDEFSPALGHDAAGVLSMANKGPDTNGSQFFLTLRAVPRLDFLHGVFGRVVRGLEVLPRIERGDQITVAIHRRGVAAVAFRADDEAWRTLNAAAKAYAGPAEPGPTAFCHDPDGILPAEPPRARAFNHKLANVERTLGLKIVARFRARSPSPGEDAAPGAFMRTLAQELGTAQNGALAVYFADDDEWRVWIGDTLVGRFAGRTGTTAELTADGSMHEAKEAFLAAAKARAAEELAEQTRAAAAKPGTPAPPAGQRVKLQADALLDGLIRRLAPR